MNWLILLGVCIYSVAVVFLVQFFLDWIHSEITYGLTWIHEEINYVLTQLRRDSEDCCRKCIHKEQDDGQR